MRDADDEQPGPGDSEAFVESMLAPGRELHRPH
jgi:hypothetical protein